MLTARSFALGSVPTRHLFAAACLTMFVVLALPGFDSRTRPTVDAIESRARSSNQLSARSIASALQTPLSADKPTQASGSLAHIRQRWELMWSADAAAAELNVGNLQHAPGLIERAGRGDLEAVIDLVGAATWCLSAGPLGNVTDLVNDERRPCYERFGDAVASREQLERSSFAWLMQLANAGVEDAVLYASALTRGIGPDLLGGRDVDAETRVSQRALLLGQLQSMAARGSADAASELHGHWSGDSSLAVNDTALATHYLRLTGQLDPMRAASAPP